jgi:pimeloyl-ACP methyl ester carboxylesterase
MKAYLLHGIETQDPERSTISFLRDYLTGLDVVILGYGYIPALFAFITNIIDWIIERRLRKLIEPGSLIIGHSNGCTIGWRLSNKIATHGLVLINPALDNDISFHPELKFIHIYWSPKDSVSWLSQFVPFSDWGLMGVTGYKGKDPRVKQFNMNLEHTEIGDHEAEWGPVINEAIHQALASPS